MRETPWLEATTRGPHTSLVDVQAQGEETADDQAQGEEMADHPDLLEDKDHRRSQIHWGQWAT